MEKKKLGYHHWPCYYCCCYQKHVNSAPKLLSLQNNKGDNRLLWTLQIQRKCHCSRAAWDPSHARARAGVRVILCPLRDGRRAESAVKKWSSTVDGHCPGKKPAVSGVGWHVRSKKEDRREDGWGMLQKENWGRQLGRRRGEKGGLEAVWGLLNPNDDIWGMGFMWKVTTFLHYPGLI